MSDELGGFAIEDVEDLDKVSGAGGEVEEEPEHEEDKAKVSDKPVKDIVVENIKEKKVLNRVKIENMQESTENFLENAKPVNSKRAMKTAIVALETIIKQLHPDEQRGLLEIPHDDLAQYVEEFFKCVVKEDGSIYNASTLSTYYNSIARYFVEKKQLDIKKDQKFSRVSKILTRRQEESVREGEIPGKNAAKAIPNEVLAEVIAQGMIGYDGPKSLTANVIKSFQAGFGIRNREEMYEIRNRDVEIGPAKLNGVPEYIELGERITKTRRGKRGQGEHNISNLDLKNNCFKGSRDHKPRIESDDLQPENCLMRPFLTMQSKKTPAQLSPDQPLFLTCLNSEVCKDKSVWFSSQR